MVSTLVGSHLISKAVIAAVENYWNEATARPTDREDHHHHHHRRLRIVYFMNFSVILVWKLLFEGA